MKARILALLLALVMVASLFAACSAGKTDASGASTGASQTTDDSKTTEDTKPAKTEKTKIVYWHAYTDQHEEKFLELAAAFNASQDEYELVAEQQPYSEIDSKTMQAVRNGTGPDLVNMYPSDAVNYLNEGRLVDLSVYINDPEIGIPNFKDNVPAGQYSEITQWGDGIYVFPCTTAGEVLFYNKTMFDKYGLEAPKTWTELAECSKIIHEKEGIPGFGTDSLVDTYQCLIMQAGSGYIDEDGNYAIDETIAKEKLNWFADLVKSGDFRLVGEDVFFSGPFGSQAVASYIGSSAGVSYVELAVNDTFEIGCVPIPQEGPVRYISSWGNNFACLSTDEDHARGAYMFLKFLTSTENIVQWAEAFGTVPIYKEARESAEFQQFAETNIAVKALTEEADDIACWPASPAQRPCAPRSTRWSRALPSTSATPTPPMRPLRPPAAKPSQSNTRPLQQADVPADVRLYADQRIPAGPAPAAVPTGRRTYVESPCILYRCPLCLRRRAHAPHAALRADPGARCARRKDRAGAPGPDLHLPYLDPDRHLCRAARDRAQ